MLGYIRARFLDNSSDSEEEDGSNSAWYRMTQKMQESLAGLFTMTASRHAGGGYSRGRYTQMGVEGNV